MKEIKRRRWTWIGHVIRMPSRAILQIALRWTPNAGRRRVDEEDQSTHGEDNSNEE